jgi:SEL1 protein
VDFDANDKPALKKRLKKEAEDRVKEDAKVAASFLGRMAMRGEGMAQNYRLARLWYERAAALGEAEAHNGLGVIYRDGLGVTVNRENALRYFETAASSDLADAQVNIARMYIEAGDLANAVPFLEAAQRNGSPFEAFYLLASMHATAARSPSLPSASGDCGVSVSYYKLVSELGAWEDDYLGGADRAWGRGEEDKALLGWWIAAEMGYEAGQNNVAFLMSRDVKLPTGWPEDSPLALWIRSAAQGNADAMVMVGDHYCA